MRVYSNTAQDTSLDGAHDDTTTTLTVGSTAGWPDPGAGDEAVGAIEPNTPSAVEVFTYTGKTATTLTGVTRGQDGTTASAHADDATVAHIASAADIEAVYGHASRHGTAGEDQVDHGNTAGVDHDDHSQYVHTDGRRNLTGALGFDDGLSVLGGEVDLNGFEIVDYADKILATTVGGVTYTPEPSLGMWRTLTLDGNITIDLSSLGAGQTFLFDIIQDATGGHTVGFTQTVEWPGGTAFAHTGTAGSRDRIVIDYDGTTYTGNIVGQDYS